MRRRIPIAKRRSLAFDAKQWDIIAAALCVNYHCGDWQECTRGEVATLLRRAMLVMARAIIKQGHRPGPLAVDLREADASDLVLVPVKRKCKIRIPADWFPICLAAPRNFIRPITGN
jgi:hypothetical protein